MPSCMAVLPDGHVHWPLGISSSPPSRMQNSTTAEASFRSSRTAIPTGELAVQADFRVIIMYVWMPGAHGIVSVVRERSPFNARLLVQSVWRVPECGDRRYRGEQGTVSASSNLSASQNFSPLNPY